MSERPAGFDWPALMRVAFQGLGLSPEVFWAMTPAEFMLLLGPENGTAPLRRDAFEALLERFPDHPNETLPEGERDGDQDDRDG